MGIIGTNAPGVSAAGRLSTPRTCQPFSLPQSETIRLVVMMHVRGPLSCGTPEI